MHLAWLLYNFIAGKRSLVYWFPSIAKMKQSRMKVRPVSMMNRDVENANHVRREFALPNRQVLEDIHPEIYKLIFDFSSRWCDDRCIRLSLVGSGGPMEDAGPEAQYHRNAPMKTTYQEKKRRDLRITDTIMTDRPGAGGGAEAGVTSHNSRVYVKRWVLVCPSKMPTHLPGHPNKLWLLSIHIPKHTLVVWH